MLLHSKREEKYVLTMNLAERRWKEEEQWWRQKKAAEVTVSKEILIFVVEIAEVPRF